MTTFLDNEKVLESFDEKWNERFPYNEFSEIKEEIKSFIHHLLSDYKSRLLSEVEGMEMKVPTNRLMDVAMALRDPKTLSEDEKRQQEARDFALKRDHIICGAHNQALSNIADFIRKEN